MNPDLQRLQPYPFERLRALFADLQPPADLPPINLSIGEPRHPTPPLVRAALVQALDGLSVYPATAGAPALREAIAAWIGRRFAAPLDPATQVLPVNGTREALFAFAQAVIDRTRPARVVLPNPFYQIYEGAALLAGATPLYLPTAPEDGFRMPFERLTDADWAQVQLVYVCSPGNPTGRVMRLEEWQRLFELSARHGFVIAADECYSEIYCDEAHPPLGSLQAARRLGLHDYDRLVSFGSLSKRSNVPGLRSGYVAGDARILRQFLLYRTYHGNAMSPAVQAASIAAWNDEAHVRENRRLYAEKFARATPRVAQRLPTAQPEAGFYLWARTPGDDTEYARRLYARRHVTVLPGSFLAREVDGRNPGRGFVRIALVASVAEIDEAAQRIASLD
ncbi:MAG: succinyldiaminopimelate transaminase [Burkholderiaceae bacterium]|nr:succinyldiaminopimelate transaminase [Burkholderiaceae bacterium]